MPTLGRRDIHGNSISALLGSQIDDNDTAVTLQADPGAAGWPTGGGNGPFTITFERGTPREERASGSSRTGLSITISERGIDGTAAISHEAGTPVEHTFSGFESDWANQHYSDIGDHHVQYLNTTRHAAVVHTSGMLGTDSVTSTQIAAGAVGASEVADGSLTPAELNASMYGVVGSVSTIDPDDAGSAGVGTALARIDHQHPIVTNAPVSLTRTTTSTEGAGPGFARDTHVHGTPALGWGVIAYQVLTTTGTTFSADATSDFSLPTVAVDSTRLYTVNLKTHFQLAGTGGTWVINLHVDGTLTDEVGLLEGFFRETLFTSTLWTPTTGTKALDIRLDEVSDGATVTFIGTATQKRCFWVEDIGPR